MILIGSNQDYKFWKISGKAFSIRNDVYKKTEEWH